MGDFEDTFGVGADAVDIIDGFSKGHHREDREQKLIEAEIEKQAQETRRKLEREAKSQKQAEDFLKKFESAYLSDHRNLHIKILLEFAILKNPDVAAALQLQLAKLEELDAEIECGFGFFGRPTRETLDEQAEQMEVSASKIARVSIGALMMAEISQEIIRKIYACLPNGRYSNFY